MSIKTDAVVIRDETTTGANTATRVGTNLVDIADDLVAKQAAIDLNTAKETNIAHPLVEKAVPSDAVFTDTDTIYNDADVLKDADTLSPVTGVNKLMTQDDIAGLGGGDMLSSTYDPIINANTAKVGITVQQASDITTNNAKVGVTTEEANPDVVSQVEAEAGTATTERIWTAERVKQAIVALGGSGGVSDAAYSISWDGVIGVAPSQNALYDFIESQVFKVDTNSNISPVYWGGTQAEYDIDFPSGHPTNYFVVITDGAVTPTTASDIVFVPNGSIASTDVQAAIQEVRDEAVGGTMTDAEVKIAYENNANTNAFTDAEKVVVGNTTNTNTGDQVIPVSGVDFDPVGTDNSDNNAANTTYANDYRAANFVAGTDYQVPLVADTDYLSPSTASTTYAPVLGADDNYVTDAEKVVVGNTSGTNTGDNAVNTLYSGLVSATTENVKAINDRVSEDLAVTGTKNIDWSVAETFRYTMTGATVFSDTNLPANGTKVITIHMDGAFAPTYPAGWSTYIRGVYDTAALNTIVIEYVNTTTDIWLVQISQKD